MQRIDQFHGADIIRRLWTEIKFWGGELLYSVFTVIMTGILAQYLGLADGSLKPIKNPHIPSYAFFIFVGVVLFLYFVRYLRRVSYGMTEIEVAIIGFFMVVEQNKDNFNTGVFTLSIASAVYLAIRGLDNVVTGAKAHYAKLRVA